MRRSLLPCALALVTLALAACGNKGPLFMPPPAAATKPGTPTPPVVQPAHASTVGPAPTSTSFAPFNPITHP
ncbi:lipoprotein [Luteibacter sp. PPL201]|uniref:Lipoprotein n=1 Tax=Luteibacter sahnii TaxID=3021977 RepID=A0ABT6BFH0_9GAMM